MRRRDDGVSLVLVLIIVTVIAVVTGAIVSQADTSVHSTVALRTQAGSDYAADGAGQVAINKLRQSTFSNAVGTACPVDQLSVPYPGSNGLDGSATGTAFVTCTAEAGTGTQGTPVPITDANRPGQAIFTYGDGTFGASASGLETDYIHGSVSIGGTLTVKASISVTGTGATLTAGTCGTGSPPPPPAPGGCSSPATGHDPGLAAPSTPSTAPVAPVCPTKANGPEVFSPGLYPSTPEAMPSANCTKNPGWFYFKPGVYWFTYTGQWSSTKPIIAGTLSTAGDGTTSGGSSTSPSTTATLPAAPGACVNPIKDATLIGGGVEFVMAGSTSGLNFGKNNNQSELCSSYVKDAIFTVLYATSNNRSTVVEADSGSKAQFFLDGYVYAPSANIYINAQGSNQPFMNYGVAANTLFLGANPSTSCPTCAYINLPDNSPGFGTASTIVDLSVYVCPASTTCSATSGKLQLTGRVQIYDPNATITAGQRQMKILSWSQQR